MAETGGDGGRPRSPRGSSRPDPPRAPGAGPPGSRPPAAVDAFLGRDEDLVALGDLVERSRVVTVTGPPGMGKTRLASEFARRHVDSYPDGAIIVYLAPVAGHDMVARAVAAALGVAEQGSDPAASLAAHFDQARALLVFDNCEHVLDACAPLVAALVAACPNLRVLATSQERLSVPGERVWALSGLAVPEPGEVDRDPAAALGAPAVRLFGERAQSAVAAFQIDTANARFVADICRRLDGIPLAIELAAARIGTFSVAEIAARLDDRFAFLTGGSRAALPRHQTLRAAVDWSYDLLAPPEQALLRRLSVFSGGAGLDAVEEVCIGDGVDMDACPDLLAALVARSLAVPGDGTDLRTRYRLLETIRLYGRDRLVEAGEVTAVAGRHLQWCVALAETAEAAFAGAPSSGGAETAAGPAPTSRPDGLAHIDDDYDNLRAAMSWSLAQGPTEPALRVAGALALYWRSRSRFREGYEWLDQALAVNGDAPPDLLGRARWGRALMALMLGEVGTAEVDIQAGLELAQARGDARGAARALLLRGTTRVHGRPLEPNVASLQLAIALARQVGDGWCLAQALAACGSSFAEMGDLAAARSMLSEAVAVARTVVDPQCLGFALAGLGRIARTQGDYPAAGVALEEALGIAAARPGSEYERVAGLVELATLNLRSGSLEAARSLLDEAERLVHRAPMGGVLIELRLVEAELALFEGAFGVAEDRFRSVAACLSTGVDSIGLAAGLGQLALARSDVDAARTYLDHGVALAEKRTGPVAASLRYWLGVAARLDGDHAQATNLHHEALLMRAEAGDRPGVADTLEAMAGLAARTGRAERAARVFGAAAALRESGGYVRHPIVAGAYEADLAFSRESLGGEAFSSAWSLGRSMSVADVVSYLSKGRGRRTHRPVTGVGALTDAERQVARLVFDGLTNPQIAARLFVSLSTVKTHLTRVFTKLEVSGREELTSRYSKSSF